MGRKGQTQSGQLSIPGRKKRKEQNPGVWVLGVLTRESGFGGFLPGSQGLGGYYQFFPAPASRAASSLARPARTWWASECAQLGWGHVLQGMPLRPPWVPSTDTWAQAVAGGWGQLHGKPY